MRPAKIVALVVGSLAALLSLGLVVGGTALVWIHLIERGAGGYYNSPTGRFETPTYALTSEHIDLGADVRADWTPFDDIGTARIVARSTDGAEVFVGIAPHEDVERYLAASAHDQLETVDFDPFEATFQREAGEARPAIPGGQGFWAASATGPGRQTLIWEIERGEWDVVVMNADASRGVTVDARVGINTGVLLPIGLALLAAGLVSGALATLLVLTAVAGRPLSTRRVDLQAPAPAPPPAPAVGAADAYPLRLDGRLDEPLNRWLWLVKWLLAIPHAVVLAFLWAAFAVTTFAAGVAILFTGRYPRGIFDFNVGVLRWTWRVTFYAFALATDRYPPFTLQSDPTYPADLDVAYPEQLSRPLVLVKWWLLALPHYLIIAVFGGGIAWWSWGTDGADRVALGAGLIGVLVLVAAVALAFTGRYLRTVFDFVMGMYRWTYRVWAYAALLRDEYPPFRLDSGGVDPGSVPRPPGPPSPPAAPATEDDEVLLTTGPR